MFGPLGVSRISRGQLDLRKWARRIVAPPALLGLSLLGLSLLGLSLTGCSKALAQQAIEPADTPHVEGNRIVYSANFAKRVGLEIAAVKDAIVVPSLSVVGTVTFDPEHVARAGTRLRGLVRDVDHFEGDIVRKGQVLATVDSPELGEAQAAVASLQAEFEAAARNAEREQSLAESKLTTLRESEQAATLARKYAAVFAAAKQRVAALSGDKASAETQILGVHSIRSPIDGTVIERHISKGQLVEAHEIAYVIANLDYVWVELAVFEQSVRGIEPGNEVTLQPLGMEGSAILGRVANVGQVLREATRASPIRVEVDNKQRKLRPGQAVEASIRAAGAAGERSPVVPLTAVILVDGGTAVFVSDTENSVRVSPVELGATDNEHIAVTSGVKAGDRVVVNGAFELKSELFR